MLNKKKYSRNTLILKLSSFTKSKKNKSRDANKSKNAILREMTTNVKMIEEINTARRTTRRKSQLNSN